MVVQDRYFFQYKYTMSYGVKHKTFDDNHGLP